MKKMKAEQKRKLAAVIAIVLIVSMILSAALPIFWASVNAAPAVSDYTIEANVGFDGYAKINSNVPVTVTVTNNSDKSFKGEVSVLTLRDTGGYSSESNVYNQFAHTVELAPGGSKTVNFNVSVRYIERTLNIQLTKNKGKNVVAEVNAPLNVRSYEECWVGLLSDNADTLTYLRPDYFSSVQGSVIDLSAIANKVSVSTDCFNVYVVNDFDFAAVDDLQLVDIIDNISNGSVMLIGNASRIGSVNRLGLDNLSKQQLFEGSESYKLGKGSIILCDANFADVNSINADEEINSLLYGVYDGFSDLGSSETMNSQLIGYTDRLPNLTDNTIKIIMCVIYLYIIFIPILYIILKKKDKRENAIKIIPMVAVGISMLIYIISFNTVYKKPIAAVINYIDLTGAASENIGLRTFMNVISPSKGDIEIIPEGTPEIIDVSDNNYDSYSYDYGVVKVQGDKTIAAKLLTSEQETSIYENDKIKWENTYILLKNEYTAQGGFDGSAEVDNNFKLKGNVTNNTGVNFSEAVFVISSDTGLHDIKRITDYNNGDIKNLEDFAIDLTSLTTKDFYEFRDSINPYSRSYSRDKNLKDSYRFEMEQDIIEGICGDYDADKYGSNYNSIPDYTSLRVMVIGFSQDSIYGGKTEVNGKRVSASEINVFRDEVKLVMDSSIKQEAYYGKADYPTLESNSNAEINSDGLFVYDTDEYVELSFYNPYKSSFVINWENGPREQYIYNNLTGWWYDLENIVYAESNNYVDGDGKIRIKASGFDNQDVPLPTIEFVLNEN